MIQWLGNRRSTQVIRFSNRTDVAAALAAASACAIIATHFLTLRSAAPAITLEKYGRVKMGMSYRQVADVMGDWGEKVDKYESGRSVVEIYLWTADGKRPPSGTMVVILRNDRLIDKFQSELPSCPSCK